MGNRLSKIYTKTGDGGDTSLGDGRVIDKASVRIEVIGNIDELNSLIGVLRTSDISNDIASCLLNIQHRLFDIGGELAVPGSVKNTSECVTKLEQLLDVYNAKLPSLKEFVLPGGSMSASLCHLARSVCRRCERGFVALSRNESVNSESLRYLNRLSDLLFVLARTLNLNSNTQEILWDSERLRRSV